MTTRQIPVQGVSLPFGSRVAIKESFALRLWDPRSHIPVRDRRASLHSHVQRGGMAAHCQGPCYCVRFTLTGSNFLSSRADDGGPRAWKRNLCTQRELSDEKVAGSTEQYFVGVGGFEDLSEAHPGHLWIRAFATAGHQVERLGRKRDLAGKREVIFNGQTTSVFGQL